MNDLQEWYVVKQPEGHCEIVQGIQYPVELSIDGGKIAFEEADAEGMDVGGGETAQKNCAPGEQADAQQALLQQWGPYESKQAAIAHRVGLIRSGKCKPV